MIAPGHLQNQFYFPGADMGIWGQEPLANQLLMSYSLLSPVAMDQTGNAVPLDATGVANSVDPISGLGQTFSGIALNGSMPGMMMGQPPLMSTTSSSSGSLEDAGQNSGSVPNPGQMSNAPQPEKPKSWAAIASQPAKPRPPPPPKPQPQPETFQEVTKKPQTGSGMNRGGVSGPSTSSKGQGQGTGAGKGGGMRRTAQQQQSQQQPSGAMKSKSNQSSIVGKLQSENKYNPSDLTLSLNNARFFVIKSYAEDDIHRSIKYNIWTSTEHGNRRLDQAFRELNGKGNMYLFYSVNGSGHFCGMAQMTSGVDFNTTTGVWAQDKWKGRIEVKWIYVKDVPNSQLRHIRLENNENKPVTNSRDTQEIPMEKGKQVIKIVHNYHHTTSIFDDFEHYEKKQEEEESRKVCCSAKVCMYKYYL